MTNLWHDADPSAQVDASPHELGSVIQALKPVSLTGIRVWSPSNAVDLTNRKGHLWATDGTLVDTFALPDHLPLGWTSANLSAPRSMNAGDFYVITYANNGNYGATGAIFNTSYVSSDVAMCFPANTAVSPGNGRFSNAVNIFPTSVFNASFFGVDAVYAVTSGTAPTITGVVASATGLSATAAISATDPDTLVGATYAVDWGDGTITSGASATQVHSYAVVGSYPLLISVTDATGLSAYRAQILVISVTVSGLDVDALLDPILSHAMQTGYFDNVNSAEPKNAPGNGLSYAVWLDYLGPAPGQSGLISTTALVTLNGRIYTSMLQEPSGAIDPLMMKAASALISAYSADFDLGGSARDIDLLGQTGQPLSGRAGYLDVGGKLFRCYTLTIPIIVNDAWVQVA
jgi:hypothetical protein